MLMVEASHSIVVGAAIYSTKYKMMALKHGQAAYTYLSYSWPVGSTTVTKKWYQTCDPARATGFVITIVPDMNLRMRQVKATLPKVCTTGK